MHLQPLDDWRWHCPCGAHSNRMYGLCSKCQARAAWWRRTTRGRRITRRAHHHTEAVSE